MCDCFHLAFPNWHAASGTGAGRRLRGPEAATQDDSTCDEPPQFTEGERPRPQGSSPVEEYPESEKYTDSDKECEAEHDPHHKSGSGKKTKKSGLGSMFEKRSTSKMSKLKEVHSPESEVIVKTAKDGCAEGLIYGGGGKEGIFIKEVVPESPASKSLKLKEGDQILSATVYFDNVSYEDAVQILEHAQAYKLKLCLKRKSDIEETEHNIESDVIHEEGIYTPQMREQGKTKRRGDARISWPKFPSFGKGRKSRFTRSHSSSEADEQRKLELSPTTSDTESPIKSQDALKGKKKHKLKLSVLKKRGRISSSEEQDTDAPTGQISSDTQQTQEFDLLSPECLESPSGAKPQVYVTEVLKVSGNLGLEQNNQTLTEAQTVQHGVELISIASTLKTTDLTMALADQGSPSGTKSPDGKKKKKEKSELKIKILGKDKSHKKDGKAKSSPKRLKTLGASVEIADQAETEKSDIIPSFESHTKPALDANTQIVSIESSRQTSAKSTTTHVEMGVPQVELNISDVSLLQKSPQKGEDRTKKGKNIKQKEKQKQEPTFKLPKIGFGDIATEETIQKLNVTVEERTTKIEQFTTEGAEVKEDLYERLSKSSVSRAQLPKREDIEIPGMEDMSMRTTAKGRKEPKAVFTREYEDIQAETVQLSIDVDSVKEAVSKLPGFKLPKVDTSGVPIPEEITVIDANAQRISVKTPTKVADTRTKHEAHFMRFDITASPEISKTTIKQPKITPADFTSEELLIETKAGMKKTQKEHKSEPKPSNKEIKAGVFKREDITIPGKESLLQAQETAKTQRTERIILQCESGATKESDKKSKKAKISMASFGIAKPDMRIPDIGINLPQQNISETTSLQEVKKTEMKGKGQIDCDVKIPQIDGIEYIDSVDGSPAKTDVGFELTGFDFNLDAKPMVDISFPEIRHEVIPDISVNVPDGDKDINIDGAEIGTLDKEGKGRKFKMPNLGISMPKVKGPKIDLSLSKKDVPEVKLPQAPQTGIKLASADVSIQEQKMEEDKPQREKKPQETESELDGQGGKLKMPKFGIKMPKIKGPEFDLNLSKKDVDVKLPEGKFEVTLPEAAETDVTLGSADFFIPEQKMDTEKPELEMKPLETQVELDGQGSKFKMPKFGITMPKLKGPEVDLSLSKKDEDVTLSEAKGKVKLPDVELKESSAKMEVRSPEIKIAEKDAEGSALKFKMPSFKLPQFAATVPQISAEVSNKIKDIQVPETQLKFTEKGIAVDITTPEAGIVDSSSDVKTLASEFDGKGGKFKMPRFGISMPRVKGPEIDSSLSKKDVDVTLPEAGPKGKLAAVEVKAPETAVHQDVEGSSSKFQMPTFKLPKLAIGTPNLSVGKPDMDKDVQIEGAGINIPEEGSAVDIAAPSADVVSPSMDIKNTGPEHEGKGGKFKMPNLGFSMPNMKGPKIDLSLSKKDVDVTIPDAKVEVKLPKVDLGKTDVSIPEVAMDVKKPKLEMQALQTEGQFDGQGDNFKMPKLGIKTPKVKGPEIDLRLSKKDVDVAPQTEIETKLLDAPKIDLSLGKSDVELEEQDRKFKLPKFEMSMPQVKGPEFHLGLPKKDVDVTTSENKADINFPDVKPQGPSGKIKIKAPEIEVADGEREGSSSALKMPSLSFSMPKVKGPDMHLSLPKNKTESTLPETEAEVKFPEASKIDVTLGKAEVLIPEAKVEVKKPKVQIKPLQTDVELDGQGGKFKMPKFGITMPKVKGPEIDLNFSKKDVNVKLPEAKADVKLPEAPKIDVNLGKIYVSIPETKIENERPELEIQLPQSEGGQDGQGSKFKMPQFGISMPKVKGPDIDFSSSKTDVDVKLPETKAEVSLAGPDIKDPSAKVEIKAAEIEPLLGSMKGSPSKFKLPTFKFPKFGVTTPNISSEVPDADKDIKIDGADMHISVTPTDMDIPKVNADVHMPEVELKEPSGSTVIEQQPGDEDDAKPKKIRFSLPKFSFSKPSGKAPKVDASLQDVNVAIPEGKMDVKGGKVEMKPPECEEDVDGQESKFKMPKFGITMPKVTGPEIDLSLSKKAGDVTLPEAKVEVKLPDVKLEKPSAEVDIKAPEIKIATKDTDGSPSKFNMPTIKLPKFGLGTPSGTVDVPDMDKDVKIDGADIKIPEEILTVNVAAPSIDTDRPSTDMKITRTEHEGKGSKFKLPSLGISVPQAKGPNIDFSLSKKDGDVTLPKAKAEVKLPNVKLEKPSAEVDIKAPEIKVVTKDTDGSPSKFKMQPLKLPKFGISTQSGTVEMPNVDKDVKIDGADIKIPEEILTVNIAAPSIDTERPSIDMKITGTEHEGKGSKFKLPSLGISVPQAKGPNIDFSLSKKDVDVTLPEAKAEVKLPDVELEKSSAEMEIKAPKMKVVKKDTDGSPSKFKMPTFKLPKFGLGSPSATIDVPDMEKDVKIDGADIKIPEEILTVNITAPSIDTERPSIDMKITGTEHEGKGSKFKLPSLGISVPQAKGPNIDFSLSKKDGDVTLPEAKAEVKLPDVKLEKPSAEVDIKAPDIDPQTGNVEGSPSKFKMPTFKLPKFGAATPQVSVEVPDMDKGIKVDGADIKLKDAKAEVKLPDVKIKEPAGSISIPQPSMTEGGAKLKNTSWTMPKFSFSKTSSKAPEAEINLDVPKVDVAPSIDTEGPSIDMAITGTKHEGKGSKFKLPSLGISVPQAKGPEIDFSLSKKDVDVTLPEAKAEVKLPDVELEKPSAEMEIKAPKMKVVKKDTDGSPSKFKMPTLKLPKFGLGSPSATVDVPDMDKDVKIDGADIKIPEEILTVNIAAPSNDTERPSIDMKITGIEHEGKGSKFKLPSLGISVPQAKGPNIDFSLSKKDGDVTLPEAKAEVKLPDVKLEKPSAEVDIKAPDIDLQIGNVEGSPSKFKMPTFKLPKFGAATPQVSVEVPDIDKGIKVDGADIKLKDAKAEVKLPDVKIKEPAGSISIPQASMIEGDAKLKNTSWTMPKFSFSKTSSKAPEAEINLDVPKVDVAPSIDTEGPSIDMAITGTKHEGKGSKFKLPSLGISVPQAKGPEIDFSLSKKNVDVTLPEAKAEVKLPDVELEKPSAEMEIKAAKIKVVKKDTDGSPSKFKMPTFKLPKFGLGSPSATVDVPDMDKDVKIDGADIKIPEEILTVNITAPSIDTERPSIDMKITGIEHEGKESKFKLPSLGISVPQAKGPNIDFSLSKKDGDVTLPEAKAEVKLPDVKLEKPSAEVDIKAPDIDLQTGNVEGSPSKFKMPAFKLPKFGAATPQVSVEVPDIDKGIKVDGADIKLKDAKAEVKLPDVKIKEPAGSISIPQASMIEGDAKLKNTSWTMPKFSFSKTSSKAPEAEINLDVPKVDVAPSIDTEGPSIDMAITGTKHEGKGSKFKLPSLGISVPQAKGPEIDFSLSKKDVDVTLPEAKAEVKLPDVELEKPSAEMEIKAAKIKVVKKDTDGSPSKFKMPTFKLPKFGLGSPSATVDVPDMDKDVKIDGADIKIPEEILTVNITAPSIDTERPSIDMKITGIEHEGKESKFKLPSLGISVPQAKGPEIDFSLSKKDGDVTLPEAKAEVKLPDVELEKPSAEMEIKAPKIKVVKKDTDGSPSKFKMPTFKLPKFGLGSPSATVDVPDMDKDVKIDGADIKIPEEILTVNIAAPSIDTERPSIDMKITGTEHEGKGSKFKLPSLGISVPQAKGPNIDFSLSKKDVDVTLPEAKAEVKLPDVKLEEPSAEVDIKAPDIDLQIGNVEGSPSKFKMPTFKLPKFGAATPQVSVEVPDMDKGIKVDGADIKLKDAKAEVKLPDVKIKEPAGSISIPQASMTEGDAKLKNTSWTMPKFSFSKTSSKAPEAEINLDVPKVDVAPSIDTEGPSIDIAITGTKHEGKGSKFKLPSLGISVPQAKGPEIDFSLSKKDVDVTLPEAKAEVKLPDVELEKSSAEMEIKAPKMKVVKKDTDGSPSKFKMPTFKLPKFGLGSPSATVDMPDMDKDVKIDGADIKIPEEILTVNIAAPSIDTERPSIDMKITGTEHEGKESKFKLPSLGISVPQAKGPNIDFSLSKKDVDVTLPEAKAEVKLPDVKLEKPSAEVDIKAPDIDLQTGNVEGSPSKFKMPTFKLPKFGAATPQVSVEVPDMDKGIKVDGADIKLKDTKAEGKLPDVKIKEPAGSISIPQASMTEGDAKLKNTSWTMPKFSLSKTSSKAPEAEINLDVPKVDLTLPEVKTDVHLPDIDIKKSSGISIEGGTAADFDAKLKKPRFSLPKFSFSKQSTKEPEVDASLPNLDVSFPEGNVEVKQPEIEFRPPQGEIELDGQESKFKIPKFGITMPKAKDLNVSKKDVDITLPEVKAEVKLPDVKTKQPSAKVEIKASEIEAQAGNVEVSPSKLKMTTITFPKFGAATPKVSVEVPDVEKDIKLDAEYVAVKAKGSELKGSEIKFKMPSFGISKKDIDVTLPEAKAEVELPNVEVKGAEGAVLESDASTIEVDAKLKRSNWTFPKFSFSRTGGKAPDVDVNLETPKVDVTSLEAKAEVGLPNVEVKGPSGAISVEEPPVAELDPNLKKTTFSMPRFSFSKSSVKEPEMGRGPPHADVSVPEGEVKGKHPEKEMKAPELEAGHDGHGSPFKLPKFGIVQQKGKGPEVDLNASQKDVDVKLPGVKAEVKLFKDEVKESSATVEMKTSETEAKSKDFGDSPSKFKMPTLKMQKFGSGSYDVTIEAPNAKKVVETEGTKLKEDVAVTIKVPSVDIKTGVSKPTISETPKDETAGVGHLSPSKFKLPSFKMPKLSFSNPKPVDEYVPVDTEYEEDQLEMGVELKGDSKSPKLTLTSFGEILKGTDVEFDGPKTDKDEETVEASEEVHEADEPTGKEKETNTKQEPIKSPERTGWFKFPRFSLSSPSEPPKIPEKGEQKDEKSPASETGDEDISPTSSVQSSDAFADISSTVTSEPVGLSLSSPTKVTVKYSDPNAATGLEEMHSSIITSTTRTELISVEPNLPEKITILSSGVSSSSEDTLRLESGKIHVITSNIQATPESQHARLLTDFQIKSAEGLPLKSEANEAALWTVEDSQSGMRAMFERHLVREASTERRESKETVVITKQITHVFDSSEPISGETASSIQRLRDSVHSDKMRFFDGAKK